MIRRIFITLMFGILTASLVSAEPRRFGILFLGDTGHRDPIERYRVIKQALRPQGFNFSYVEDLEKITQENLNRYDALWSMRIMSRMKYRTR